jgi:hypothetical protein
VAAVLPPPHRAAVYGGVHPGRTRAERAVRSWAGAAGVALLDLPALVGAHVLGGHGNPDGMHWGWVAHADVGAACADLLRPLLPRSAPAAPGDAEEGLGGLEQPHDGPSGPAQRRARVLDDPHAADATEGGSAR